MAKDPNYDRYKGIVTLPNPWGPPPRPYRVDEDGRIIYRDEELDAVRSLGEEKPVRLAELGQTDWNGYEAMRAQGQRHGKVLKDTYDDAFPPQDPNAPPPPASRQYSLPPGAKPVAWDHQHRFLLGKDGRPIENPAFREAFDATETNTAGVVWDLGKIAVPGLGALRGLGMGLRGAQAMVGVSTAKEGYDLAKGRGSRKGAR
ncbi:hypothetical protein HY78_03025 [Rhizorhabdus wittichii DC-6]|nr:hypothetical protein HY78_03025 [Rhizorhabdus wittichii DC-6]